MNIAERYVCALIVEIIFDIKGADSEKVHDYLSHAKIRSKHRIINNVLRAIRRHGVDSQMVKNMVLNEMAATLKPKSQTI